MDDNHLSATQFGAVKNQEILTHTNRALGHWSDTAGRIGLHVPKMHFTTGAGVTKGRQLTLAARQRHGRW